LRSFAANYKPARFLVKIGAGALSLL